MRFPVSGFRCPVGHAAGRQGCFLLSGAWSLVPDLDFRPGMRPAGRL